MNRRTQQEMEEIEEQEEADYVNASRGAVDKERTRAGRRFVLLIAVCWLILLAIMGLRIYFHTLSHESDPNQLEEVSTLRANNTKLSLENANMKRDNKNLEDQLGNLTQAYTVSESNVKDLSAGVQELETEKKNLNQKIHNMTTNWNELSISRAQWSINSYCLGNTDKKCQPCQKGWLLTEPSCYAYNDPKPPDQKTWEEAQEDCSGRNSNLAVANTPAEKNVIINKYSPGSSGTNGFWIGLRVEDGKWKWVDGSDLTESSWIDPPAPVDGHCAISVVRRNKWFSVSCDKPQRWICQKKALTLSV